MCVYLSEATPSGSWGGSVSFMLVDLPMLAHCPRSPGLEFGDDYRKVSTLGRPPLHSRCGELTGELSKESTVSHAAGFKLEHACVDSSIQPWDF